MIAVILLSLGSILLKSATLVTLDDLKWNNRIIVTFSNDKNIIKGIFQELKDNEPEINDRDIIFFLFDPDRTITNSKEQLSLQDQGILIHQYYHHDDQLKVILIGKDGGVKLETDSFDLQNIFQIIDAMPMRQREMRSR
jgi:hypothetical protein